MTTGNYGLLPIPFKLLNGTGNSFRLTFPRISNTFVLQFDRKMFIFVELFLFFSGKFQVKVLLADNMILRKGTLTFSNVPKFQVSLH